ncbi:MAG TPA: 6-phosphogluconolactonase [Candidatus Binatia bacterium]|nr:6-phosphogluconolactonase [Candidatus Binatia bacterium]
MHDRSEIRVLGTPNDVGLAGALQFVHRAKQTILENALFTVALCGGSTCQRVYSRLVGDPGLHRQLSWQSIHFFWNDERHLPPDHPQSNYGSMYQQMISKLLIPSKNVHRFRGDLCSARQAAAEYERQLRKFFAVKLEQVRRFDLVLLNVGADGHIASLFPGSKALRERKCLVVADRGDASPDYRITMTLPVLNDAACVIFFGQRCRQRKEWLRRRKLFPALASGHLSMC